MVTGSVSVATGVHSALVFSVSGSATLDFARSFAAAVATAQNYTNLNTMPGASQNLPGHGAGGLTEYLLLQTNSSGPVTAVVPGSGYVLDNWSGANTITGSGQGDTVLVAGINSAATYVDKGGNNQVVFTSGNNVYSGSAASTGNDTIVTGPGFDSIYTGVGDATIFGGTGNSRIFLNDTATGTAGNDRVFINEATSKSLVIDNGVNDFVAFNSYGDQVFGSTVAGSQLAVVFGSVGLGAATNTGDVLVANNSNTALWDYSSGNVVFGGSGQLVFLAGGNDSTGGVQANVYGGTGENIIFGNSGANLNLNFSANDTTGNVIVAGNGNETLFGGNSSGNAIYWGNLTDSGSSGVFTGGSGSDTFVSGLGNETMNGGSGTSAFVIADNAGTNNVLINDFAGNASNYVHFNYDQATLQQALDSAKDVGGNLVLQLGETTVTFTGITSVNNLHIK